MRFFHGIRFSDKRGITLVWLALFLLPLLLFFAGLAIDIAFMYNVKNHLQVAADAAALAGGALVLDPDDLDQVAARTEAVLFASKNSAAGSAVSLIDGGGGNNSLSSLDANPGNDITVGNWNSGRPPNDRYHPNEKPVNAIEVRPRRTGGSPGGPVTVFFGQVLRFIGADWSLMSVQASAIAARPAVAEAPIAICRETCTSISESGTLLYWSPYPSEVDPGDVGIAWTSFNSSSQQMEKDKIISYFCGATQQSCGLTVYTTNGYDNALARQFRCAFKNPLYDSANKTCEDGSCDSTSDNVTSWNILLPLFESPDGCPPGDQPAPEQIVGHARLSVIEVYASGGGGTNNCACDAYDAPALNGPNAILATGIDCLDCPASEFLSKLPVLVK